MSRTTRDTDRPYSGTAGRDRLSWPRVLVRFFIVVIPAQLVGTAIGGAIMTASGVLREDPQLANLITVMAGVVAGIAVGLLVLPPPDRRRTFVVVHAAFAVGSYLLLLALAQLRLPDGTPQSVWYAYLLGPALVGLVQTLVAWGLWVTRQRL